MKKIKSTILALSMGVVCFGAISTSANELQEKNVMVQIHQLHNSDTKIDLDVNGKAEVFSLPDLEIGETKDIVTENGSSISIARSEDGYTVSIDGEDISLPRVGSEMSADIVRKVMPLHANVENKIQVIGDLTDEQIAIIKDGFAAAGVEKEIKFSKGHEMKFISIGDHDGNYEFEFGDNTTARSWVSDDGTEHQFKVLSLGDKNKHVEIKSKVIVIEEKEDN